jgi:hypothetical protein
MLSSHHSIALKIIRHAIVPLSFCNTVQVTVQVLTKRKLKFKLDYGMMCFQFCFKITLLCLNSYKQYTTILCT